MKVHFKRISLGLGGVLVALATLLFASRQSGAASALKIANSVLYNRSLVPIAYSNYQQKFHKGMSAPKIQEQLRGQGTLFVGTNTLSSQVSSAPLAEDFTGVLKLHDGCCGNFSDCGSAWLVLTFEKGKLKKSELWLNTF